MRTVTISLRALLVFTGLTGVLYPLLVTGIAHWVFPKQSQGSVLERSGTAVGSRLLAQKFESPGYFAARPSASDYGTVASGASNLSPAGVKFVEAVHQRQSVWGASAPADLVTASGSGLDPHLSPEAALFQVERVAHARGLDASQTESLKHLVGQKVERKTFGILGRDRVNVLELNLALDESYPRL